MTKKERREQKKVRPVPVRARGRIAPRRTAPPTTAAAAAAIHTTRRSPEKRVSHHLLVQIEGLQQSVLPHILEHDLYFPGELFDECSATTGRAGWVGAVHFVEIKLHTCFVQSTQENHVNSAPCLCQSCRHRRLKRLKRLKQPPRAATLETGTRHRKIRKARPGAVYSRKGVCLCREADGCTSLSSTEQPTSPLRRQKRPFSHDARTHKTVTCLPRWFFLRM